MVFIRHILSCSLVFHESRVRTPVASLWSFFVLNCRTKILVYHTKSNMALWGSPLVMAVSIIFLMVVFILCMSKATFLYHLKQGILQQLIFRQRCQYLYIPICMDRTGLSEEVPEGAIIHATVSPFLLSYIAFEPFWSLSHSLLGEVTKSCSHSEAASVFLKDTKKVPKEQSSTSLATLVPLGQSEEILTHEEELALNPAEVGSH